MRHKLWPCPRMFGSAQAPMRTVGASTSQARDVGTSEARDAAASHLSTAVASSRDVTAVACSRDVGQHQPSGPTQFMLPQCLTLLLRTWMRTLRLQWLSVSHQLCPTQLLCQSWNTSHPQSPTRTRTGKGKTVSLRPFGCLVVDLLKFKVSFVTRAVHRVCVHTRAHCTLW